MLQLSIVPAQIVGFDANEVNRLQKLLNVYNSHSTSNYTKNKYYEGKISLNDVNLGLALPDGMSRLEIGCAWGAKTVDVLAGRSMFDGFVGENGEEVNELTDIIRDNNLIAEYPKTCRDELKIGCSFATLSADDDIRCRIRFHSAKSAAAVWDGEKGRIAYGFAITDTAPANDLNMSTGRQICSVHRQYLSLYFRTHLHATGLLQELKVHIATYTAAILLFLSKRTYHQHLVRK